MAFNGPIDCPNGSCLSDLVIDDINCPKTLDQEFFDSLNKKFDDLAKAVCCVDCVSVSLFNASPVVGSAFPSPYIGFDTGEIAIPIDSTGISECHGFLKLSVFLQATLSTDNDDVLAENGEERVTALFSIVPGVVALGVGNAAFAQTSLNSARSAPSTSIGDIVFDINIPSTVTTGYCRVFTSSTNGATGASVNDWSGFVSVSVVGGEK